MNIGKMMQQARKMQENLQKLQQELAAMEVTGEAGGGMVRVTLGGDHLVRSVEIDDAVWQEHDKSLVEDLIVAACNAAAASLAEASKRKQQELMAGMPLPPGFSL